MTNDRYSDYDAAYVMGALSPLERDAFERHLTTCDSCAGSVRSLGPVAALLGSLPDQELAAALGEPAADSIVPATLLPRLLGEVRRSRRRRRWITGSVAAAVAACLITVTVLVTSRDSAPARHPVAMHAVTTSSLHATADIRSVGSGTLIELRCRYDHPASYSGGSWYVLVVTDRSGVPHQLGSWQLDPGKDVTPFGSGTALHRADIASVQITTRAGVPLLDLSL